MTAQKKYFLAGDIGGTKTLLGLFFEQEGRIVFAEKRKFPSKDYLKLTDIIDEFVNEIDIELSRDSACFGIAGPCEGGVCKTRNLPWVIDSGKIKQRFGFKNVFLINDFEAVVHGILHLAEQDLEPLNQGVKDPMGNIAVLGAGTGLGEALATYERGTGKYRVCPSEGGHSSFSPTTDDEVALLSFLRQEFDHVSFERVLSGDGLVNIFRYLESTGRYEIPQVLRDEIANLQDPAAVIAGLGLEGKSEICSKALDMFVSIYGVEAGNLALKILPTGGLYLAGGIAAKIRKRLQSGLFVKAFLNKGRSKHLLKNIPVSIVLNPEVGLIGAAARATE